MTHRSWHLAPFSALLFCACATGSSKKAPTSVPAPTPVETQKASGEVPRALKKTTAQPPWDASLLSAVPAGAVAVIAVGPRLGVQTFRALIDEIPAMKKELATFLNKALGVDPIGQLGGGLAVIVTALQPQPQVCLRLPLEGARGRALKGTPAGQHAGVALISLGGPAVAALIDDALLVGTRGAVTRVIDQRGSGKTSVVATKLGPLARVSPLFAASVDLSAIGPAAAAFGLQHATATVDARYEVSLEVEGDPSMMGRIPPLYAMGTGAAITRLLHQKTMAKRSGDIAAGTAAIFSYHLAKKMIEDATPRLDEQSGKLRSRFRVPLMDATWVPTIGVLAAVAIPNFIKYLRKAKASEARESLIKLKAGAEALDARKLARLKSTPWTPKASCCKQPDKKCADTKAFSHPTFRALGFAPSPPYRYQLRVERKGRGKKMTLKLEARGDLDCDGVYSSFVLVGATREGQLGFSQMVVTNELE